MKFKKVYLFILSIAWLMGVSYAMENRIEILYEKFEKDKQIEILCKKIKDLILLTSRLTDCESYEPMALL
ncbi:hypothetical protein F8M41_002907 [Gigaspora margarita]|uniref:Uncharacterized protein n=1 Tax=Gigaspora margarita TaxID=4874 RepID=A0A8H4ES45_GIGMA|nr:hypothetical protein F8M41_002907 [Gigaspora margarita]